MMFSFCYYRDYIWNQLSCWKHLWGVLLIRYIKVWKSTLNVSNTFHCGLNTRRYKKKDFLPFVGLVLHLISKFTYIVYEFVFAAADNGDGDADADDVATAAATIANSVSDIRTQHLWSFDETSEEWLHTHPALWIR